ncbi:Aldolase-type TIM barrel [Artemisia annua]|uniref:Aldolase-type TIM barrel n=1 Tax=Artemisia annua TaxID=35608 RepID=A0A2U1LCL3_ARTAN|nr:Aldolase-type TIM barrel [Artemisia annua]
MKNQYEIGNLSFDKDDHLPVEIVTAACMWPIFLTSKSSDTWLIEIQFRPLGNEVIGSDLGATNSHVAATEGKTVKYLLTLQNNGALNQILTATRFCVLQMCRFKGCMAWPSRKRVQDERFQLENKEVCFLRRMAIMSVVKKRMEMVFKNNCQTQEHNHQLHTDDRRYSRKEGNNRKRKLNLSKRHYLMANKLKARNKKQHHHQKLQRRESHQKNYRYQPQYHQHSIRTKRSLLTSEVLQQGQSRTKKRLKKNAINSNRLQPFEPSDLFLYAVTDSGMNKRWGHSVSGDVKVLLETSFSWISIRMSPGKTKIKNQVPDRSSSLPST